MKKHLVLLYGVFILIMITDSGCSNSKPIITDSEGSNSKPVLKYQKITDSKPILVKYKEIKTEADGQLKAGDVNLSKLNEKSINVVGKKIIFKIGEVDLSEVKSLLQALRSPLKISGTILYTTEQYGEIDTSFSVGRGCWIEIDYESWSVWLFVPPDKWTIW